MRARRFAVFLVALLSTASLGAATFVVRDDLAFFKRAAAVVVASPLASYTRLTDAGVVQTVSTFSIEERCCSATATSILPSPTSSATLWASGTRIKRAPTIRRSHARASRSFIPTGLKATLQPWDQHAVDAVYPGSTLAAPAAPTGVNARATSTTSVSITWNASTGATSYDIFRRAPGAGYVKIGSTTGTSITDTTASPNTAYLYFVRAINTGGSADSAPDLATTVIFTDDPLVAGVTVIKAGHLAELRTAVNAVRTLANLGLATFTDAATPGVIVRAVHINELRTALDRAMSALGFTTGGWTDTLTAGVRIKAKPREVDSRPRG